MPAPETGPGTGPPGTFSSEIGDVHEHGRGNRPSFTDEFRGASDSLIDRERPPRPLEVGRRGRRLMFWLIFGLVTLGGGGWVLWYWSEPIGQWIAGWNAPEQPQTAVKPEQPEQSQPTQPSEPEPPEPPEPTKVFGVKGAPEGSEGVDTPATSPVATPPITPPAPGEGLPVEPLEIQPVTQPVTQPVKVEVASTSVRGRVSSSRVGSKLGAVDSALAECWTSAAAKPGTKRPATLTLSFTIKWNGRLISSSVGGDAPEAVKTCAREALPSSGWPQPRDGGEGQVTRTWTLQ